ncbi:MAG: PIG-L family deacetylase [Candidatus Lokiarchaeota archaeon]|nr:PIG-L family deacetylase [Candidatus Lokiarchaeota archaeon]
MTSHFRFLDLDARRELDGIDQFFPEWRVGKEENVVVLSPHDDDGILGAGYAILASLSQGAQVHVVIFHKGDAGYSIPSDKESIVETRKHETVKAYRTLGIQPEHVLRLEVPDFSGNAYVGKSRPVRDGEDASLGTFEQLLVFLRKTRATRLLLANGFREHIDHVAVADSGIYYGPQAGDPVVVDWADPWPITSFMEYSVWGDFDPVETIRRGAWSPGSGNRILPANRAIVACETSERLVQQSLRAFASQQAIIKGILEQRQERRINDGGFIELYMDIDPRPRLDYQPYKNIIEEIGRGRIKK